MKNLKIVFENYKIILRKEKGFDIDYMYRLFVFIGITAVAVMLFCCIKSEKISKLWCGTIITFCVIIAFSAFGVSAYFGILHWLTQQL